MNLIFRKSLRACKCCFNCKTYENDTRLSQDQRRIGFRIPIGEDVLEIQHNWKDATFLCKTHMRKYLEEVSKNVKEVLEEVKKAGY